MFYLIHLLFNFSFFIVNSKMITKKYVKNVPRKINRSKTHVCQKKSCNKNNNSYVIKNNCSNNNYYNNNNYNNHNNNNYNNKHYNYNNNNYNNKNYNYNNKYNNYHYYNSNNHPNHDDNKHNNYNHKNNHNKNYNNNTTDNNGTYYRHDKGPQRLGHKRAKALEGVARKLSYKETDRGVKDQEVVLMKKIQKKIYNSDSRKGSFKLHSKSSKSLKAKVSSGSSSSTPENSSSEESKPAFSSPKKPSQKYSKPKESPGLSREVQSEVHSRGRRSPKRMAVAVERTKLREAKMLEDIPSFSRRLLDRRCGRGESLAIQLPSNYDYFRRMNNLDKVSSIPLHAPTTPIPAPPFILTRPDCCSPEDCLPSNLCPLDPCPSNHSSSFHSSIGDQPPCVLSCDCPSYMCCDLMNNPCCGNAPNNLSSTPDNFCCSNSHTNHTDHIGPTTNNNNVDNNNVDNMDDNNNIDNNNINNLMNPNHKNSMDQNSHNNHTTHCGNNNNTTNFRPMLNHNNPNNYRTPSNYRKLSNHRIFSSFKTFSNQRNLSKQRNLSNHGNARNRGKLCTSPNDHHTNPKNHHIDHNNYNSHNRLNNLISNNVQLTKVNRRNNKASNNRATSNRKTRNRAISKRATHNRATSNVATSNIATSSNNIEASSSYNPNSNDSIATSNDKIATSNNNMLNRNVSKHPNIPLPNNNNGPCYCLTQGIDNSNNHNEISNMQPNCPSGQSPNYIPLVLCSIPKRTVTGEEYNSDSSSSGDDADAGQNRACVRDKSQARRYMHTVNDFKRCICMAENASNLKRYPRYKFRSPYGETPALAKTMQPCLKIKEKCKKHKNPKPKEDKDTGPYIFIPQNTPLSCLQGAQEGMQDQATLQQQAQELQHLKQQLRGLVQPTGCSQTNLLGKLQMQPADCASSVHLTFQPSPPPPPPCISPCPQTSAQQMQEPIQHCQQQIQQLQQLMLQCLAAQQEQQLQQQQYLQQQQQQFTQQMQQQQCLQACQAQQSLQSSQPQPCSQMAQLIPVKISKFPRNCSDS